VGHDAIVRNRENEVCAMTHQLKLSLADAVRQSRRKRGLSQIDLAQRMGSSQSRVAKMEVGNVSKFPANPHAAWGSGQDLSVAPG